MKNSPDENLLDNNIHTSKKEKNNENEIPNTKSSNKENYKTPSDQKSKNNNYNPQNDINKNQSKLQYQIDFDSPKEENLKYESANSIKSSINEQDISADKDLNGIDWEYTIPNNKSGRDKNYLNDKKNNIDNNIIKEESHESISEISNNKLLDSNSNNRINDDINEKNNKYKDDIEDNDNDKNDNDNKNDNFYEYNDFNNDEELDDRNDNDNENIINAIKNEDKEKENEKEKEKNNPESKSRNKIEDNDNIFIGISSGILSLSSIYFLNAHTQVWWHHIQRNWRRQRVLPAAASTRSYGVPGSRTHGCRW